MSTINRRIKVKFRDAVAANPIGVRNAFFDLRSGTKFPDATTSVMSGKECCQTVLKELTKTNKSDFRYKQKIVKVANSNCNAPLDPAATMLRRCRCMSAMEVPIISRCTVILVILVTLYLTCSSESILVAAQNVPGGVEEPLKAITSYNTSGRSNSKSISSNSTANSNGLGSSSVAASGYLDKLDNLERSVAAVLIKVAYGTTSTTKRSIPDNSYILGLTTVATPLLTTLRYQSAHQAQNMGSRHRNYELDLERDHALPTSAPNADILKSNNNPTYPNPNRHHNSNHDRDRHRHTMQYNSTPMPSIPNLLKKASGQPTIPMYPGDIPSYSPPSRAFFTPPLPPEYQNPFADKPTLRGTNNEGLIANTVTFNNRRPIPPPSLMPGHERIPFRPPDLAASIGNADSISNANESHPSSVETKKPVVSTSTQGTFDSAGDRKKALNTPSRMGNDAVSASEASDHNGSSNNNANEYKTQDTSAVNAKESNANKRQEVLPNIRRILGSNGKKIDIPDVLLRQVTQRPVVNYHQPPASPIVSVDNAESTKEQKSSGGGGGDDNGSGSGSAASPNINKSKQSAGQLDLNDAARDAFGNNGSQASHAAVTTPSAAAAIGEAAATSFTLSGATNARPTFSSGSNAKSRAGEGDASGAAAAAAASAHTTWTWAWNIHIYLSVILFTILSVYSLYKLLTYNKLTHLFAQSYFVYIHLILIAICVMRIFYLCFDAYNIHGTFHIFAAELLLNLPLTLLTVAFSVLILFLFLKSLNHKNNRYSALVRPLTVVVGCGVHVGLCITLHYVESYTLQNHHNYFQQQQQQQYFRRQQQAQAPFPGTMSPSSSVANTPPPPRVLSLICQIIYIFICISLGVLYLYLYRILKRILRSKSQNYIHGYQNLSYAIQLTIATALLFVLLAAVQIFGAVCISTARPLMSQANIVEVDWMQWGYQFSLRLIEIAIITLISWVTGLKTSVVSNANAAAAVNGDVRMVGPAAGIGIGVAGGREKHSVGGVAHHNSHSNVANFFLPCTSSSSQEQFETDYPAICNTNTNLHTYTMRTGKLIYDDSYALNSLAGPSGAASPGGRGAEYHLQEPMYQRPYDTGSIRSAVNHTISAEYGGGQPSQRYHHPHHHHTLRAHEPAAYMSADYMTDATTDHYENPNFDLRTSSTSAVGGGGVGVGVGAMHKLSKNNVSSGSASGSGSGSGSGSSGTSQQQMLLLQSDSCYSEPLQENSSYEFNNFERPVFKEKSHPSDECWPDRDRDRDRDRERDRERHKMTKSRDRKQNNNSTLERATYENPERRSSNSTNSCSSSNGVRYASYNSYDRGGHYGHNGVRKSGTLNNIVNGSTAAIMGATPGTGAGNCPARAITVMPASKRMNGAQTLALAERSNYYQRSGRMPNAINRPLASNDLEIAPTIRNELSLKQHQLQQQNHHQQKEQQQYNHNHSEDDDEEEEEDDDDMMSGRNVECANLISNNEHGSCITNDNSLAVNVSHLHVQNNPNSNELSANSVTAAAAPIGTASASNSSASDSMIVAEQGFLRFRANEDINNVDSKGQQVAVIHGVHGGMLSVHQQPRGVVSPALTQICSSVNGIDC